MSLPKTLTIAGHVVTIKYKKGLMLENHECWGIYDSDKSIIWLRLGMDKTRKQEILLHEILHAISDIHLLNLSEKQVKILGIEVLAAIKNNRLKFN